MEEDLVIFETAKLAKEKGFNWEGQVVFDLKENNFIVNLKDIAIKTFIDDCETGYRDKALNYFKEDIIRTDDNTDEGYYILAPTQSLLQKYLREVHNIEIIVHPKEHSSLGFMYVVDVFFIDQLNNISYSGVYSLYKTYEEALETGLQEALKLIEIVKNK